MNLILAGASTLSERVWQEHVKTMMPDVVQVIGRVIGQVIINDLGKMIQYNQIVDFSVIDAKRSSDLMNAISKKWVDVVSGKQFLQIPAYSSEKYIEEQPIQQQIQPVNKDEINKVMQEVASINKSMSAILETIKNTNVNNNTTVNIDNAAIEDIVSRIADKLPTTAQQRAGDKIGILPTDNVFVDLDENIKQKANLNQIAKTKEEKVDISNSLKKMKRFKKIKK